MRFVLSQFSKPLIHRSGTAANAVAAFVGEKAPSRSPFPQGGRYLFLLLAHSPIHSAIFTQKQAPVTLKPVPFKKAFPLGGRGTVLPRSAATKEPPGICRRGKTGDEGFSSVSIYPLDKHIFRRYP